MYVKIKIAKLKPNSFGKNDIMISQIQAVASDGTYIKAVKLTQDLVDQIIDAPIVLDQENPKLLDILN